MSAAGAGRGAVAVPGAFLGRRPDLAEARLQEAECDAQTQRWLYPAGSYTVVRRLSSKEERRRVVAGVVDARAFPGVEQLGFENHLNVFHQNKRGLPLMLAHGLAAYLNSTIVDEAFRSFNGHTQVNASDLRRLDYPSLADLQTLGAWAAGFDAPPVQDAVDARLEGWLR